MTMNYFKEIAEHFQHPVIRKLCHDIDRTGDLEEKKFLAIILATVKNPHQHEAYEKVIEDICKTS